MEKKMTEEKSFIDQLLEEAEEKEKKLEQAQLDLILIEIRKLEDQVEKNFDTAAQEREIIKNWALERNTMLSSRIEWLSKKLETYLREEKLKTLDLPNGIIRIRKQPEKIAVMDEEKFFKKATSDLLNIIPETAKPDLLKIRSWIKRTGRVPEGVEVSLQEEKFSYTIKRNNNGKEKTGTASKPISKSAVVV
jgi:hypothetical protein